MTTTTFTKDDLQQAAYEAWEDNGYKGLIAAATGSGKTKLGIMAAEEVYSLYGEATDIVLVAPFVKLLTENWPAEFHQWNAGHLINKVTFVTYNSFNKLEKRKRSLIILDEAHHMTKLAARFFENNPQDRILMLSATPPTNKFFEEGSNAEELSKLGPVVFSYPLDKGVKDGLIADYRIWVVDCQLDNKTKYIPAGTKAAPFLTTEASGYLFINKKIRRAAASGKASWKQALINERMHFIYNLRSKMEVAKKILNKLPQHERTIVFCGSIAQAEELLGDMVYHSKSGDAALQAFKNQEINRLAVVRALDEGHNLPNVDNELIVQATSVTRQMVQRIGRAIRFRPGHRAKIFVLCTQGTADENWVESSLETFDQGKISRYSSNKL